RGSLVPEVLEEFIQAVLARPADQQPAPDQPWGPADAALIQAIGEQLCDDYEQRGRTGRAIFWRRDRRAILADLQRFLTADSDHRRRHRTRPLAVELAFGFAGSALAPAPLLLPDGRTVPFLGKA